MGDGCTFRQWFLIAPHDILEGLFTNAGRPIGGPTLIGTIGDGFSWDQKLHPYILHGNIVADWQSRFEQEQGTVGLSYGYPAKHDAHMPGTRQDIHALVGIACMRIDLLLKVN